MQPDPNGFIMAAKKQWKSKSERARPAAPVAGAFFRSDLSTAARGVFNMTVVVVTSGSVLLCLFAAKRLL